MGAVDDSVIRGEAGFERCFRAYQPLTRRIVARTLGERSGVVEDIVATVWLKASRAWSSLARPEHRKSWLCAIAAREAVSWQRVKRHRFQFTEIPADGEGSPATASGFARVEAREILDLIERELPEQDTELILLYLGFDYTSQEIAERFGIPRPTVAGRLARAVDRALAARRRLEGDGPRPDRLRVDQDEVAGTSEAGGGRRRCGLGECLRLHRDS